jgi:hypothetical protein
MRPFPFSHCSSDFPSSVSTEGDVSDEVLRADVAHGTAAFSSIVGNEVIPARLWNWAAAKMSNSSNEIPICVTDRARGLASPGGAFVADGRNGASARTDEMTIKSICSLYLNLSRTGGMGWISSSDSSTQLIFTAMKNCSGANGGCLNSDTKTSVIFLSMVPGSTFQATEI